MIRKIKNFVKGVIYSDSSFSPKSDSSIKVFWWNERPNIGDAINYDLVKHFSFHREVEWVPYNFKNTHFSCVGSVAQLSNASNIIWGSGFISSDAKPFRRPKAILAVRGPLTKKRFDSIGISTPNIFGDPALLLPEIYIPRSFIKKFKLGIIPHYVDKGNNFFKQEFPYWVKVIDVETINLKEFVDDVCSCEFIISSSLHGIIIADSYQVPSCRVKFSEKISGGDFKFADYSASVSRKNYLAYSINLDTTLTEIFKFKFELGVFHGKDDLLGVCPFGN